MGCPQTEEISKLHWQRSLLTSRRRILPTFMRYPLAGYIKFSIGNFLQKKYSNLIGVSSDRRNFQITLAIFRQKNILRLNTLTIYRTFSNLSNQPAVLISQISFVYLRHFWLNTQITSTSRCLAKLNLIHFPLEILKPSEQLASIE